MILVTALLACTSPAPPAAPRATPETTPAEAAPALAEDGWGAVFWRDGVASLVGGGDVVIGPEVVGAVTREDGQAACGALVTGAPPRAVLALPAGTAAPEPRSTPAINAALVERAAWRIDELLPPRDAFSPAVTSPDPALQRGIRLSSASKGRRAGAPPILFAVGARDCVTQVAVLSDDASEALASDRLEGVCDPPRALPPADLDGDGALEVALYSDARVLLYRVSGQTSQVTLTRIGDWTCP